MLLPFVTVSLSLVTHPAVCVPSSAPSHRRVVPTLLTLRGGAVGLGVPGATITLLGSAYSRSLTQMPIVTKSVTAAATFALSDVAAQRLQPPPDGFDGKRTLTTALIGLLYFGPSLHFYLDWVTELIPGSGVRSTLLKTLVGQLFFGPAVTCVFFGAFLVAGNGWRGLQQWPSKVRRDLLVVWGSELCFWPFVDLLCYSFVPVRWIPLGYNFANFFWTIFLSLQAARKVV